MANMLELQVEDAVNELKTTVGRLGTYETKLAIMRSLNRAIKSTRTEASKQIRQRYNRKAKGVKGDIALQTAKDVNNLTAYLRPKSLRKRINASRKEGATDFKLKQGDKGVYATIKKGKRELIRKAFILTMSTGHVGVFARGKYKAKDYKDFTHDKARYPITELTTISTYKQLTNPVILQALEQKASDSFNKRFVHEANRLITARQSI